MESNLKLSIVIPCRNEVNHIQSCVDSVMRAVHFMGAKASVYVVDGKSDDGTIEKIQSLHEQYPEVSMVVNEQQLTPFAFNLGIQANQEFDYLIIVGSRHILSENYFAEGIRILKEHPEIWCVGGTVNNVFVNETGKIVATAMATTFGMGLGNFRTLKGSGFVDTIGTPIYPRQVFERVGYFDEELVRNQDDEFNFRVSNAGGKIYHSHLISVQYFVRGNFKGLWRQFFQYGYWKVYVNKKHRAVTTMRQLVPPLFVGYLFVWMLSLLLGWFVFAIASVPVALYAFMAIYFAVKSAGKADVSVFAVLKTFPIMHIAYGLGYLKGIGEFFILGKKPSDKQKKLSR